MWSSPQCSCNHCWWRGRPWPPSWSERGAPGGSAGKNNTFIFLPVSLWRCKNASGLLTSLTTYLSRFFRVASFKIPYIANSADSYKTINPEGVLCGPLDVFSCARSPCREWSPWRLEHPGTCFCRTWTSHRVWTHSGGWKGGNECFSSIIQWFQMFETWYQSDVIHNISCVYVTEGKLDYHSLWSITVNQWLLGRSYNGGALQESHSRLLVYVGDSKSWFSLSLLKHTI